MAPKDPVTGVGQEEALKAINSGDTAWMLASAALVLLMTPGVAFFYGELVGIHVQPLQGAVARCISMHGHLFLLAHCIQQVDLCTCLPSLSLSTGHHYLCANVMHCCPLTLRAGAILYTSLPRLRPLLLMNLDNTTQHYTGCTCSKCGCYLPTMLTLMEVSMLSVFCFVLSCPAGGMSQHKNVVSTIMQAFVPLAIIPILFSIVGYVCAAAVAMSPESLHGHIKINIILLGLQP